MTVQSILHLLIISKRKAVRLHVLVNRAAPRLRIPIFFHNSQREWPSIFLPRRELAAALAPRRLARMRGLIPRSLDARPSERSQAPHGRLDVSKSAKDPIHQTEPPPAPAPAPTAPRSTRSGAARPPPSRSPRRPRSAAGRPSTPGAARPPA